MRNALCIIIIVSKSHLVTVQFKWHRPLLYIAQRASCLVHWKKSYYISMMSLQHTPHTGSEHQQKPFGLSNTPWNHTHSNNVAPFILWGCNKDTLSGSPTEYQVIVDREWERGRVHMENVGGTREDSQTHGYLHTRITDTPMNTLQ